MISWITVLEYMRKRNLSRSRVNWMIENGELEVKRETDSGKILIKYEEHEDILNIVFERINSINDKIEKLCIHLGVESDLF